MTAPPEPSTADLPSEADVVVVGGGIAGASVAYHLASSGLDTLLIERNQIGAGTTAAAVGILAPPMRQPFHQTARFRGAETARLIWELAARSITGLAELIRSRGGEETAELDLRGGYVLAESHTEHEVCHAFQHLQDTDLELDWLCADEIRELTGGRGFTGGYRIRPGGGLDPVAAVRILVECGREEGLTVVEGVEVRTVERSSRGFDCRTPRGPVRAGAVVYANHLGTRRFSPFLAEEIVPIRGQALLTEPVEERFPGGFATHWKMNLWRQRPDGALVLSGWRHDAWNRSYRAAVPETDEQLQRNLRHWFEHAFPWASPLAIRRQWSGIFGWTADYLPLVGPLGSGEHVAAGFSGGALPFAFEAGRIIAAALNGREPLPGAELFSPARFARFHHRRG